MPRRRIGRGRLTEGEAGELDERHFDPDITLADVVKQSVVPANGEPLLKEFGLAVLLPCVVKLRSI